MGFGDFYPVTNIGRFIIVISCFGGMFMISQFVYTLQVRSQFTLAEQKAFELLRRLIQRKELQKEAASVIHAWWRARKLHILELKKSEQRSEMRNYVQIIGLSKGRGGHRSLLAISAFANEIFYKKLEQFRKDR